MKLNDEILNEFITLNEEIKLKTKRLEEIKEACKQKGSFSTKDFVCSIEVQERLGLPGFNEVIRVIERETLEALNLVRKTKVIIVRVNKKQTAMETQV